MEIFLDAQGQLTLQSEHGSGENLNSSKHLWLSSLPGRMMKIRAKMKAQKSGINIIHIFVSDAQGQITLESVAGTGRNTNSSKRF